MGLDNTVVAVQTRSTVAKRSAVVAVAAVGYDTAAGVADIVADSAADSAAAADTDTDCSTW